MVRTKKGDVTEYYHRGVVCHLIGFEIAAVMDVELLKPGEGEVPAAKRMLERVFPEYGRFFDVVVADGLYLEAPFVNFCVQHGKHVLITVKGDHRLLLQDAAGLFADMEPEVWELPGKTVRVWDVEGFTSCEGIEIPLRVLRAEETDRKRQRVKGEWIETIEHHSWCWATTIPKKHLPSRLLWKAGHGRWEIENDAFHALVTHWGLDHCFRHDPTAIVNFVLTLFIVFVLMQSFYFRNLKPPVRRRLTLIAMARQLFAGLIEVTVRAPWPVVPSGTPP